MNQIMKKPEYLDGVQRNKEHPDSFHIPSDAEKAAVRPGDYVKIGFPTLVSEGGPSIERMWVQVTSPGKGTLGNDPVFVEYLSFGSPVEFQDKHILSIITNQ